MNIHINKSFMQYIHNMSGYSPLQVWKYVCVSVCVYIYIYMGCMCVCNMYILTCIYTHMTTFYTFCTSIQQLFEIQLLVAILEYLCILRHHLHICCKGLCKIRHPYRNLVGKSLIKQPFGRLGRSLEDNQILERQLGRMGVWLNWLGITTNWCNSVKILLPTITLIC